MKKVIIGIFIGILISALILGGYYYFTKDKEEKTEKPKETVEVKKETQEEKVEEKVLTDEEIGCQAVSTYFESKKSSSANDSITSYKINSCKLIYGKNDQGCDKELDSIIVAVSYDVTSPTKESMWVAGNGDVDFDNLTVRNKSSFMTVSPSNGNYAVSQTNTGC